MPIFRRTAKFGGKVQGAKVAWIGDGNNVCNSWAIASQKFDFELRISTPADYAPNLDFLPEQGTNIQLISDPMEAARGVDIVVTDTWASMGQEYEKEHRQKQFEAYSVTQEVMDQANPNAVFMHCLPAYRGMEVDAEVIDGRPKCCLGRGREQVACAKSINRIAFAMALRG